MTRSDQISYSVVSDSLRPHESQHTRPPCPSPAPRVYPNSCQLSWWCHPAISSSAIPFAQLCPTFCNPMDCSPPGSSVHGDSPNKNTGVGCHAVLQGIFPTQGSNSGLPHWRQILYHLSTREGHLIEFVVQSLSHIWLWPPRTGALQASLPFTISRSLLKLMFIESVMLSNHLVLIELPNFMHGVIYI